MYHIYLRRTHTHADAASTCGWACACTYAWTCSMHHGEVCTKVVHLWMDMKVPWCVDYANRQFSLLGEGGSYSQHWICLHQDNFCKGSFDVGTEHSMKLFESMLETAGKPVAPCDICTKPLLDSVMCEQCNKGICTLCMKKWCLKCREARQPTTCPFCRHQFETEMCVMNYSGVISDLKG